MSESKYPFPTPGNDELESRFGIEPKSYSQDQLEAAALAWNEFLKGEQGSALFVKLLAVCEGYATEATVLWDALRSHRTAGLQEFLERPSRYYGKTYQASFLGDRRCRRAFETLADRELIIEWPQKKNSGHEFRVNWVELSVALDALKAQVLPGLDGAVIGVAQ